MLSENDPTKDSPFTSLATLKRGSSFGVSRKFSLSNRQQVFIWTKTSHCLVNTPVSKNTTACASNVIKQTVLSSTYPLSYGEVWRSDNCTKSHYLVKKKFTNFGDPPTTTQYSYWGLLFSSPKWTIDFLRAIFVMRRRACNIFRLTNVCKLAMAFYSRKLAVAI